MNLLILGGRLKQLTQMQVSQKGVRYVKGIIEVPTKYKGGKEFTLYFPFTCDEQIGTELLTRVPYGTAIVLKGKLQRNSWTDEKGKWTSVDNLMVEECLIGSIENDKKNFVEIKKREIDLPEEERETSLFDNEDTPYYEDVN